MDKRGTGGSFYGTDLEARLTTKQITTLLVCGVTTEACVLSTVKDANDRGIHCIVISDACASYTDEFHKMALQMIVAQGGMLGSITDSGKLVGALS